MCCGILEWAQSWSFLGEKVALVCECLDWAALLAVFLLVVRQTTCYKVFDRYDMSVCTCVCIQWKKGKKRQRYPIPGMEGRPDLQVWQLFGWMLECTCKQVQTDAWKKKSCSEGNICLPFNQTAEEGCWRAKLVACCYHTRLCPSSTRLLRFKKVQSQTLTAAVPLECLYIPVMLIQSCINKS